MKTLRVLDENNGMYIGFSYGLFPWLSTHVTKYAHISDSSDDKTDLEPGVGLVRRGANWYEMMCRCLEVIH